MHSKTQWAIPCLLLLTANVHVLHAFALPKRPRFAKICVHLFFTNASVEQTRGLLNRAVWLLHRSLWLLNRIVAEAWLPNRIVAEAWLLIRSC